ncbi:MAG TPA: ion transporter [Candidatus Thermoplasmatota archaeon]|nr:ion transporter [Candidatus Thermoplasmatota archaeon]
MPETFRAKTHHVLEITGTSDRWTSAVNAFLIALIALNVVALVLETVAWIEAQYEGLFRAFEMVSVAIFTVEYVLRLWSAPEAPGFSHPIMGRLRYALTPYLLVDLIAIIPAYLPLLVALDTRFVRVLRLVRLLRVFKLGRYTDSLSLFARIVRERRHDLMSGFALLLMTLLVMSSLVYFAEHEAQPEKFPSIPDSFWWGIVTLTTVGYGDVSPVTPVGKLLGGFTAVIGIGVIALPAAILATAFLEELQNRRAGPKPCPHCGKDTNPVTLTPGTGAVEPAPVTLEVKPR